MPVRSVRAPAAAVAATLACAAPDDTPPLDLEPEYGPGLVLSDAPNTTAPLAWQPPDDACPLAYRVRIDETYPPGLEQLLHVQAEHSTAVLVLGRGLGPGLANMNPGTWTFGQEPDVTFSGQLTYRGPKTSGRELLREWALSPALVGPASPDAPCYERTWDPVEDALALGWPQLPARTTRVGEVWRGARVEARCNRSACVDPSSGAGGAANHERPCATMSWRERLDGLYLLDGRQVAQITSFWSDGQPLDQGVWSERVALVDVAHGRLLRAELHIHHNFTKIEREIRIDAVDACPGGLVAAGWTPPEAILTEQAALVAALERATHRKR